MPEKSYELFLHWKQGDDFAEELEKADTTEEALRNWAETFEEHAKHCRELAEIFEGKDIEAYADTHHISFVDDEEVLKKAVKKGLLEVVDIPEEE
ncbi:hypothetical protein AKJ45_02835 [candidate division MSBL1 archaeon SCGC-AAA261F19]|uniref:Uncharacterized protein n=1 Tax=candidate division MSBL1 archaeon SCGC-AAA261F19 TaxID=1698275 RepID=A0A133V988_9EURY|nr:hypothetical protein AKJ45_02835 [candidate division MSBL1 archaeon SCGC-AAA261F19]